MILLKILSFRAYIQIRFKHAVLDSALVFLLDVSEKEIRVYRPYTHTLEVGAGTEMRTQYLTAYQLMA